MKKFYFTFFISWTCGMFFVAGLRENYTNWPLILLASPVLATLGGVGRVTGSGTGILKFLKTNKVDFLMLFLCSVLLFALGGVYSWLGEPLSNLSMFVRIIVNTHCLFAHIIVLQKISDFFENRIKL